MDVADFFSNMLRGVWLFMGAVPEALRLAYDWAREWQTLLTGVLLIIAARILAQGSVRAARIRATAMIRSAQLGPEATPSSGSRPKDFANELSEGRRKAQLSPQELLLEQVEQLRRLVRSAMSTLTTETGSGGVGANFYCQRILGLRLEDFALSVGLTTETRALFDRVIEQLALVRQASENKLSSAALSNALVQLNGRAREFAAAFASAPHVSPSAPIPLGATEPAASLGAPVPLHLERHKAASSS